MKVIPTMKYFLINRLIELKVKNTKKIKTPKKGKPQKEQFIKCCSFKKKGEKNVQECTC